MYLECKTKRIFAIACLGKKLVFHTEICEYFEYLISKIVLFHRVKELFKSNQTAYHGQVESRTKRILAIACLGKKLVLQSEISIYSLILFSKIWKFYRVKELFKSNQTRYGLSHVHLESRTKRVFAIACLGKKKKVSFSYGNLRIFRIFNFKNRSFSSGQGVVEIKPNWVWSIPWASRV